MKFATQKLFLLVFLFFISINAIQGQENAPQIGLTQKMSIYSPFFYEPAKKIGEIKNWSLTSNAKGQQTDGILELTGQGEDYSGWISDSFVVEPGKLYRFNVKISNVSGEGNKSAPCGTSVAHNDFTLFADGETPKDDCSMIVFIPNQIKETSLKCCQWQSKRTFRFDSPTLTPVVPIYTGLKCSKLQWNALDDLGDKTDSSDFLPLGSGETIQEGLYRFSAFSAAENGNFDRPLLSTTAFFNSNRWLFGNNTEVIYRFHLQPICISQKPLENILSPISFKNAEVNINIGHYITGRCVIDISSDGQNWLPLGSIETSGLFSKKIEDIFKNEAKVETIYLRLRGEKSNENENVSFQIPSIQFQSNVDSNNFNGRGKTTFAEVDLSNEKDFALTQKPLFISEDQQFFYLINNPTNKSLPIEGNNHKILEKSTAKPILDSSAETFQELSQTQIIGEFYKDSLFAPQSISFAIQSFNDSIEKPMRLIYDLGTKYIVDIEALSPYFIQNYTKGIPEIQGKSNVDLSWTEADYKVPLSPIIRQISQNEPIKIEAAKNDFESFQIVLKPKTDLIGLSGSVSDLINENGNTINASETELRYAYYHFVETPTDSTCSVGYYPDALVPLEKGSDGLGTLINIQKNHNQPIWITVHVPKDAASGTYSGTLSLFDKTRTFDVQIPFQLNVWDFALPQKNRLETAYGMSPSNIFRYHNCQTEEDRRAVLDLYFQNYDDHRISFYQPTPLDSYSVQWHPETNPPSCEIDFSRFDKEMERVFTKYNFTNFRLNVQAMGSGTFHSRSPGKILDFTEETPEYQAMFADYANKLETHLKEKGWLDKAYCYWFDEPDPKDYEFVANGFAQLKKYMPNLTRMLTEEPNDELCKILEEKEAQIDVWCPVSPNFSEKEAEKRIKNGERFWWYVCCWPKAPYCTEFTDHPAHELRVWHWQTFERNIAGTLIWESTYWTSSAAFPNEAQNPYLDPMCYVSGYSTPPGTKLFWGNGDGRFVYPPLSAAVPGNNDGKPIFDKPVSSIRWEMIREGVEDYEMLTTLKELVEKKKDQLTESQKEQIDDIFNFESITKSLTDFTDSPQPIFTKRRAVARMILELQ
ncbi:MAG: DUF4091 domain-containing protein [Planctomycetia bacterium]|nr:DUF4091 domain-containing protein [Planctomycetia bacterium]